MFILQGSYLQDWLLLTTDWNWRLEPDLGGTLRAVGDIGSHWLDLMTFVTGLRLEEVFADFKTFHPIRKKPSKPLETYTGKMLLPSDYVDQPIYTEDYASILLHFEKGVRGVLTVAQVCSGRKNRLFFEISGSKSSLAWDGENPNELWIGHRAEPNQVLLKDPSLLAPRRARLHLIPAVTGKASQTPSSSCIKRSTITFSRVISLRSLISRLLLMDITRWCCAKRSSAALKSRRGLK